MDFLTRGGMQEAALTAERQRDAATSYRTSEVTRQLEQVQERRRIVESRAPFVSGGVLWARDVAARQERHRVASEAARQRNARLVQEAREAAVEMRAQANSALLRASRAQVDTAKKQYLDAVEALYPQWCRQVEEAAAATNQRLGGSLANTQQKRVLAAERFAQQMASRQEMASKEGDLLRARAASHTEQRERAAKLAAAEEEAYGAMGQAVVDAAGVIAALREREGREGGGALASQEVREGIQRLSSYLQQLDPGQAGAAQDPDMPPASPPPQTEQAPAAPMFQGGRWGSPSPGGQAAWGAAGSPAPLGAQGLSAVPMEVYTPDGKQQTVMVPVLGASFLDPGRGSPPKSSRVDVNPALLRHMSTPRGGGATPVRRSAESTGSGQARRRDAPAAAAAKLKQQMPPSGQFPSRYQNTSADVTPATSVDVTPHTSLDWTGKDMPGDPEPAERSATFHQDFTLADHLQAEASLGSGDAARYQDGISFSQAATPQKVSTRASALRDSQEDSVVYNYAFQSPPPHKLRGAKTPSRSSSTATSQEQGPSFPVVAPSASSSRRPSDQGGGLSAEPSAPSLMNGMGGGTLSPTSSADPGDWAVRSSVESRARSSQGKSPLGNLGDSIMSDLTEGSIDEETEEQLAHERAEWNKREQERKESVQRELDQAEDTRPRTPVIQGMGARGSRPLYRTNSSPAASTAPPQTMSRPSSASPQQARPASATGVKSRPLGVFGFGGGLGGGGSSSTIQDKAARGSGGSLRAMSSIVSKAFDDSDSDGSDFGYKTQPVLTRSASASIAPLAAAKARGSIPLSRSQSMASDEFDF